MFIHILDNKDTIYTDQTGALPVISRTGNRYQMVLCEIDSNAILVAPLKNRTEGELIKTYQTLIDRLNKCGIHPTNHILDNEASAKFKDTIHKNGMKYQLVPPHSHRRNIAKRAIQTWKNHFLAIITGTDKTFPRNLWDALLPQAELTLNLLRQSNTTPNASAYAHLYGNFDYNKHPLAPLGCAVQMHEKSQQRKTWAAHAIDGWYVGTSMEHYRSHRVRTKATKAERITDTVFIKHAYLTSPTVTPHDAVIAAAQHLTSTLQQNKTEKHSEWEALTRLAAFFKQQAADNTERWDKAATTVLNPQPLPAPVPRVRAAVPRVEPIRAPPPIQVNTEPNGIQPPTQPNYITQDEEEEEDDEEPPPAMYNTRSRTKITQPTRRSKHSVTQETLISCLELNDHKAIDTAHAIMNPDTGQQMEYQHLKSDPKYQETWATSYGNELGRLFQGMPGRVKGTNTAYFVHPHKIPADRWKDVTYGRIVTSYRPEKTEPNRTRLTIGGDKINYPDDVGTPTADLLTVKHLLNSTISTPGAKFMTLDIKDFYLNTPLNRYEYLRLKLDDIPADVQAHYHLADKAKNGFVYAEVRRGMYGLPQAGILAQELLEK